MNKELIREIKNLLDDLSGEIENDILLKRIFKTQFKLIDLLCQE